MVAKINKQPTRKEQWPQRFRNNSGEQECKKCGSRHQYNSCPAWGKTCMRCGKLNHFAKMCFYGKKVNYIVETDKNVNYDFYVSYLEVNNIEYADKWMIDLKINEKDFKCQLDTGAQINVLPYKDFNRLGLNSEKITRSMAIISTFSGQRMKVLGTCRVLCRIRNIPKEIVFYVINEKCHGVIGLPACQELKLVKRIEEINKDEVIGVESVERIKKTKRETVDLGKYKNLFEGLGSLPGTMDLKLKEGIKPHIDPLRRTPFKLMDKLKKELENMEKQKVIKRVTKPTEWVNSSVVNKPLVNKPSGELRS